ncbi:MAG: GerMN domain-containing protein [Nitrososphaerota archaeon]
MSPDNVNEMPHRKERGVRSRHSWMLTVPLVLSLAALLLAACGVTTSPGPGANTTPTATPGTTVKVFFAKHPDTDENPVAVFPVQRTTTATTTLAKATFALEEMLKGPTTAERSQNYYSPFDGKLALQSFCAGEFRNFDLTLNYKGKTAEPGTATLQFCRRVDIAGELEGPRMTTMISSTLKQFPEITKVVILNYQGNCFADLKTDNACLNGAQTTGYPVKVYFSKHPESDTAPTALFPVSRISPTLGVATYSIGQLIAGPTATEKARGYYTPLEGSLSGTSTCSGADFKITLNWDEDHPETGTATLQFCRDVKGFGDTGAVTVRNEITKTMTQFSTIKKVEIIYKDGSCFDDLVGCD